MRRCAGFTLVELILVIALSAVVGVMISTVLSRPLEGFVAQSRRAELVDQAALALNRMARDIRRAVPNSVRIEDGGRALELLSISSGGRYLPNRVDGESLRFSPDPAPECTAPGNDCQTFRALAPGLSTEGVRWLVVYNTGAESGGTPLAGSNLWATVAASAPNVITPQDTTFTATADGSSTLLRVEPPSEAPWYGRFSFAFASPQRRFYLVDEVVGYRCDTAGRRLLRFTRASLATAFTADASHVVVDNVSHCSFSYQPGSQHRAGLVGLTLRLTDGESIELFQQVQVDNAP